MSENWSKDFSRRRASDIEKRMVERLKSLRKGALNPFKAFGDPYIQLLFKYLYPKSPIIILVSLMNLIQSLLGGARVILLMIVLGEIIGEDAGVDGNLGFLGLNLSVDFLEVWLRGDNGLTIGILALLVVTAVTELIFFFGAYIARKTQAKLTYQIRKDLTIKLFQLKLEYFDDNKSGDIAYLQNALVRRFSGMLPAAQLLLSALLDLGVAVVLLTLISAWLTLVLAVLGLLVIFGVSFLEGNIKRLSLEAEEASRASGTLFLETLYGMRLVKQGQQEKRIQKKYFGLAWERESKVLALQNRSEFVRAIARFSGLMALLVAVFATQWLSGFDLLQNIGVGVGFLYLAMRVFASINVIQSQRLSIASMMPPYMIVADFLLDETHVELSHDIDTIPLKPIEREFSVDGLTFSYGSDKDVLENVSLNFPIGSITALVGLSGSGKTTLLELIAGIRRAESGRILVDGEDISKFGLDIHRSQIGYVNQETILFHDSIRENLLYLRPDASNDEMMAAVKMAMAEEFIAETKLGYDTVIGERGLKISGGQRQRIVLTRVLLQDPRVLLFDEATSSLDLLTEAKVYENLMKLKNNKIIVVAAHRLSAITNFDQIVMLDRGKIVEQGSHADLMAAKGMYYHIFSLQEYKSDGII